MSGHSKWSKVKNIKAVEDVKKGKAFSKAAREVSMAAGSGGPDPAANPSLAAAVERAKAVNMPKDRIEAAIRKATGDSSGEGREKVVFEGYGPGGVAILIQAQTDNRNRTTSEMRKMFTQLGGSFGEAGSTSYIFKSSVPLFMTTSRGKDLDKAKELIKALSEVEEVLEVKTNLEEVE